MDELGVKDPQIIIAAEVADSIANGNNEKIVLVGAEGIVNLASSLSKQLGKQ
jgi:hypothetical protein